MAFIGNQPTAVPLTSSQLADGLITTAKLASTSVTTAKVNTAAITTDKLDLISTVSVPAVTAKGTPSVSDGYIQLNCEQNSHGIKLKSPPHAAGANYTLTFPSTTGTSLQSLRMNSGATALEFATPSSGISNYFSAYDTSGAGVSGDLILSSTFVNSGSNYSTVTGLYTAPSAGDYYFWFVYSRAGGSSSTFAIEKNNSTLTGAESEIAPTANIYMQGTIQIIATLAISDTIGITTQNNAYPDKCFFGGWKIS